MSAGDRKVWYEDAVVQNVDGSYVTKSIPVSSDGNVPGLKGERSYRCVKCGLAFKESDIVMFRGKPYGVPCGDYKDVRSILFKEGADRLRVKRVNGR